VHINCAKVCLVPLAISVGGLRCRWQNSNMAAVRHSCMSQCQVWCKYGI